MSSPLVKPSLGAKLYVGGYECAATFARPVVDTFRVMRDNPRITALIISILLCAVIALAICSHYVKTGPILTFNHTISEISHFLKNPIHAGLIGGIGGLAYLMIGRELINKDKLRYGWDPNDPSPFPLQGESLRNPAAKYSPIYAERAYQIKSQEFENLSQKQKMKIAAATAVATLTAPIMAPVYKYPKAAIIMALATLILCICAHYVHTKPMQDFNNAFSKAYHAITTFFTNPSYAALTSIFASIFYIGIGREIVQNNKIDLFWNAKKSSLKALWGIGDRQMLLRELSQDNTHLKNAYECSPQWESYQEYFKKVQNEGEYYASPQIFSNSKSKKDVHIIFFNYKNALWIKEVPATEGDILNGKHAMEMCGYYEAT